MARKKGKPRKAAFGEIFTVRGVRRRKKPTVAPWREKRRLVEGLNEKRSTSDGPAAATKHSEKKGVAERMPGRPGLPSLDRMLEQGRERSRRDPQRAWRVTRLRVRNIERHAHLPVSHDHNPVVRPENPDMYTYGVLPPQRPARTGPVDPAPDRQGPLPLLGGFNDPDAGWFNGIFFGAPQDGEGRRRRRKR